jgi:hypothetical protein
VQSIDVRRAEVKVGHSEAHPGGGLWPSVAETARHTVEAPGICALPVGIVTSRARLEPQVSSMTADCLTERCVVAGELSGNVGDIAAEVVVDLQDHTASRIVLNGSQRTYPSASMV